jgi:hypothetical protein
MHVCEVLNLKGTVGVEERFGASVLGRDVIERLVRPIRPPKVAWFS